MKPARAAIGPWLLSLLGLTSYCWAASPCPGPVGALPALLCGRSPQGPMQCPLWTHVPQLRVLHAAWRFEAQRKKESMAIQHKKELRAEQLIYKTAIQYCFMNVCHIN